MKINKNNKIRSKILAKYKLINNNNSIFNNNISTIIIKEVLVNKKAV
jgi:hypothetical protein